MDTVSPINSDMLVRYSDAFSDENAEITYQSCDHVRFRIHAIYLKAHSGILPPPEGALLNEIVHLPESATILEMLFKFIYPIIQPVLALEVRFTVLKDLAEAAEKYQVFPAMYACHSEMQSTLPNHAIPVLGYALKHGYSYLANEAAPYTIDATFPDVIRGIPPDFHQFWLKYHTLWKNVRKRALRFPRKENRPIGISIGCVPARELSSFRNYKTSFEGHDDQWISAVKADVEAIPKLCDAVGLPRINQDFDQVSTATESIHIETSDGLQHYADPNILRACSQGFDTVQENIILVSETSATISLLLQYLRPARLPDLTALSFNELMELALAAEKYSIHPAMGSCRIMMKKHIPDNAQKIFQYALNTRYLDVLDIAAPFNLGKSESFFVSTQDLPPALHIPWACYYQSWRDVATFAMQKIQQISEAANTSSQWFGNYHLEACSCQRPFAEAHVLPVLEALMEGPEGLRNLDLVFPTEATTCQYARRFHKSCKEMIQKLIDEIPPLSSLL